MKETVLALVSLMRDLKMDTHVLMNLVRALKDPFRKLVLVSFEEECQRIVQGETYQPLDVQVLRCAMSWKNTEHLTKCFFPLPLSEFIGMIKSRSASRRWGMVEHLTVSSLN